MADIVHIANWFEAERLSATAGEDMEQGMITAAEDNGSGGRRLMKVDAQGDIVAGTVGIVYKVSADPLQVAESTVDADSGAFLGDRILQILSGDAVIECTRPLFIEYPVSKLDASLDPARSGAFPTVGQSLAIKAALWCSASASGSPITTPVAGRVYKTFGTTKILVQFLF